MARPEGLEPPTTWFEAIWSVLVGRKISNLGDYRLQQLPDDAQRWASVVDKTPTPPYGYTDLF